MARARTSTLISCLLAGAMVAAACGGGGSSKSNAGAGDQPTTTVGAPKRGGTITFGELAPIPTLDPATYPGTGSSGGSEAGAIFGYLMRYDHATNAYVPYMAQSMTHNDAFTVWTLTLRPNLNFTDGTPFDAAAVITNLKRYMNPALRSTAAARLSFVSAMDAPSDHTVAFTQKQPYSNFPYALSTGAGVIASPAYLAKVDGGDKTALPVGAGPFTVASYRPNEELSLVANKTFFDGAPYLDGMKFVLIPGAAATLQAFQTGQLQVAYIANPPVNKDITDKKIPNISFLADVGAELLLNNRAGTPFADVRLRKAVAMAIDISLYQQRVNQGAGRTTNQLFPEGSRWFDPNMKPLPYNVAQAKQLVDQVKAEKGWDGTIQFVASNAPEAAPVPVAIQAMLEPIGFKLQVTNNLTTAQATSRVIVDKNFDMASFGASVSDLDPFPILFLQLRTGSASNFSGYSSPDMDAAIDDLRIAPNADAAKSALRRINDVWNATVPFVNLYSVDQQIIYQPNVHGLVPSIDADVLFDKAWLS
jgi:peptide/nickel transport system substrate-binding protein